ncbi:ADP-ribosylglycohydrolase family protein [Nocardioides litoris]|uniref:ADP-ribosylglycohydrolase family protein n=1 Tax=Nocardioides litoris TaxID=1926648 RepID=UPI001FE7C0E3|nr:ADP-ribosylglycohydrolase family protein [Nocardioides litoris]
MAAGGDGVAPGDDPGLVDRCVGVLLGSAAGDALGAGYEFTTPAADLVPAMIGGGLGGFAPGEWTDDTSQAVPIAEAAARGLDLRSPEALDHVAGRFADWYAEGPADVGIQTAEVLRRAGRHPSGAQMAEAAREVHDRTGRSAGNGSLMRTGPVVLAHLDDPDALVEAAQAVAALTHFETVGREASAVWCLLVRHAVVSAALPSYDDVAGWVPGDRDHWRRVLAEAEQQPPGAFTTNGWAVGALQAAWSAVVHTPVPAERPEQHLVEALGTAIRIGHDTDTVAAIAGALLGGRWGASAVPGTWRGILHGWPGLRADDLESLARRAIGAGDVSAG